MVEQYRIIPEQNASWQRPVKDILNAPAGGELKGDRFLVGSSPSGAFATHANKIAVCTNATGPVFSFDTPSEGWNVYDQDSNLEYRFNGSAWVADDISAKQDLVSGAVLDNVATFDSAGQTKDSGVAISDVSDAISKKHIQNTDTILDEGGASEISAAQAKEAYDRRGSYDSDLGVILMTI